MINRYSLPKNLLVLAVVVFGLLYVSPNLFAPDPAIQITGETSIQAVENSLMQRVRKALNEEGIRYFGETLNERGILVRLRERERQLQAREAVQTALGEGYVVALNQADNTPDWLRAIGARPVKLGLDLSGGVHFLLEVDSDAYISTRLENYAGDIQRALRKKRIGAQVDYRVEEKLINITFQRADLIEQGREEIREVAPELEQSRETAGGSNLLTLVLPQELITEFEDYAVEQNLVILRNRVNELGVAEPLVQRQGRSRIVVELPGVQDTAQAKRVLGKFANLEFRLESRSADPVFNRQRFRFRDRNQGTAASLLREIIIDGGSVTNARSGFDENGQPMVAINLDTQGGAQMNLATRHNVGRKMGVLFVERRTRTPETRDPAARRVAVGEKYEEKRIISLAVIRSALGSQFQITGLDSVAESIELALLLRAGALSAPMDFVEERTVGPSLGAENIALGMRSVQVGLGLVLLFMLLWYRGFGIAADLALVANLVVLLALMSLLSATLTLPGIAGIVLTVGMAVDANVLIYSRIREELAGGLSPQQAIHAGYERALVTILDANITTLIVAIILYIVGTGPVRGFAVTLSLGILTSMFTAIIGTRAIVNLIYGGRPLKKLTVGRSLFTSRVKTSA